jgi:hypothetical protein
MKTADADLARAEFESHVDAALQMTCELARRPA